MALSSSNDVNNRCITTEEHFYNEHTLPQNDSIRFMKTNESSNETERRSSNRRERSSTPNENTDDVKRIKSWEDSNEIPYANFHSKDEDWYLYRIKMPFDDSLGFLVFHPLSKLSPFNIYENDKSIEIQILFTSRFNCKASIEQLKKFSRYIFEEALGFNKIKLEYDIEKSQCQLLLCLLNASDGIDLDRMESIRKRKRKKIEHSFQLNQLDIYTHWHAKYQKYYEYRDHEPSSKTVFSSGKRIEKFAFQPIKQLNTNYLRKTSQLTVNRSNSGPTHFFEINHLRYAPLNKKDLELFTKLPSILARISQLNGIALLREKIANFIGISLSSINDGSSTVTFNDPFSEILPNSINSLGQLNYDLLSTNNSQHFLLLDLLFRAVTCSSAQENTKMDSLASYGDSFLKVSVVSALYHRHPCETVHLLASEKNRLVSNETLRNASNKQQLTAFLYAKQLHLERENLNWIPPGYVASESDSEFGKQKYSEKHPADLVEALIGAVLLATDCTTTLKFMDALDLFVIPRDENREIMKAPSILLRDSQNTTGETIEKIYKDLKLSEIEEAIGYTFVDKAHLAATSTKHEYTIGYRTLKFIGNAVIEFLTLHYTFVNRKTAQSAQLVDIKKDLLHKNRRAVVMIMNKLHEKMPNLASNSTQESAYQTVTDLFDALIGAIFLDSNGSFEIVFDVFFRLYQSCFDVSEIFENPKPTAKSYNLANGTEIVDVTLSDDYFSLKVRLRDECRGLSSETNDALTYSLTNVQIK